MKNEYPKLAFIQALLGSVESTTDVTHKLPAKVYFNYPVSTFDIGDQKSVLTELKKKKVISNFKLDGELMEAMPICEADKEKICHGTAERIFKLA